MINFKEVWNVRYFIFTSVRSDFRNRVARSHLGFLWLIISPLAQVFIYAFVLSALMTQRLPGIDSSYSYPIYLLAGFQGWFLFVEILNRCITVFIENGNVLKKIAFPRIALPLVVIISSLINNFIFLAILFALYTILGFPFTQSIIFLPVVISINVMFAAGLGMSAGILNVFMRDIGQIFAIIIQFLFWLTPIIYTLNIIPEKFQIILKMNPLFWIIESYHNVLVYNKAPDFYPMLIIGILSLGLLAFSLFLFRKASPEMVDVL
jgi:lipopolysaccharide transport system permease protein